LERTGLLILAISRKCVHMINYPRIAVEGNLKTVHKRVPQTRTFDKYRELQENQSDLIDRLYRSVSDALGDLQNRDTIRASDLIEKFSTENKDFDFWTKWDEPETLKASVLEQVLWTYFFDQGEVWITTWPDRDRKRAEYYRLMHNDQPDSLELAEASRVVGGTLNLELDAVGTAPTEIAEFTVGDEVKVTKGDFKGFQGVITLIGLAGGFPDITVRLNFGDRFLNVPGFRPTFLKKI